MKYGVIVVDPPWDYDDNRSHDPAQGGITYRQMDLSSIAAMPIKEIAKPDCAVFLWATMPLLPDAFYVINSWGFRYVTCAFVWVKLNPTGRHERHLIVEDGKRNAPLSDILIGGTYSGLGSWVNGNVELCLLLKQGRPVRKNKNVKQIIYEETHDINLDPTEIIYAPRGRHSAKPESAQDRIELLIEDEDRIELFARRERKGWKTIGNELDGLDIYDSMRRVIHD